MKISVGVVMDPIDKISFKKDTTLGLLLAAQNRGWDLVYMEPCDLYLQNGSAMASMRPLQVIDNPQCWYKMGESYEASLVSLNVILMRKDPPFDNEYIYSTYILETAERDGTLVLNKPQSLRDCNEKIFATQFPQCCTPLLVSAKEAQIKQFLAEHGDIVLKPLDAMGGASIFRVKKDDQNVSVIIEILTEFGRTSIMAQRYIGEIKDGDKRILVVNGKPVPFALARIPAKGELRGNLAAGGSGVTQPLSERDYWICEQVIPSLLDKGLLFVGLDVIGDYLTEINVTSPTCMREIEQAHDLNIGDQLMDAIETRLKQAQMDK
jgi:glutathione synthase